MQWHLQHVLEYFFADRGLHLIDRLGAFPSTPKMSAGSKQCDGGHSHGDPDEQIQPGGLFEPIRKPIRCRLGGTGQCKVDRELCPKWGKQTQECRDGQRRQPDQDLPTVPR